MSKKVVLIFVEGRFDKLALEGILKENLKTHYREVHFTVADGDVLTHINFLEALSNNIRLSLAENKFSVDDLIGIIQLCDMDGCYIDNNHIIEDTSIRTTIYNDDHIECPDRESMIARNSYKRAAINLLSKTNHIDIDGKSISYELYFFSCNLEHALGGTRNATVNQKREFARALSAQYDGRESEFVNHPSIRNQYVDEPSSWDMIKKDFNSLLQSTNIQFIF